MISRVQTSSNQAGLWVFPEFFFFLNPLCFCSNRSFSLSAVLYWPCDNLSIRRTDFDKSPLTIYNILLLKESANKVMFCMYLVYTFSRALWSGRNLLSVLAALAASSARISLRVIPYGVKLNGRGCAGMGCFVHKTFSFSLLLLSEVCKYFQFASRKLSMLSLQSPCSIRSRFKCWPFVWTIEVATLITYPI